MCILPTEQTGANHQTRADVAHTYKTRQALPSHLDPVSHGT